MLAEDVQPNCGAIAAIPVTCCAEGWPSAGAACRCPSLVLGLQPCTVLAHLSGPLAAWRRAVVRRRKPPMGGQAYTAVAALHGPTSPCRGSSAQLLLVVGLMSVTEKSS